MIIILIILLTLPTVLATSHYSYEHAEELKPLIDWRDYGPSAFDESIYQNKPIFLLLTAPSWCYWCQVYESEEYLFHPDIIEYINEYYIPIYVDADQRQDLTRQYLEGGWPSTTILTPSRERLFGFSGVRPVSNMITNLEEAVDFVNNNGFSNQIAYNYIETEPRVPTNSELASFINSYSNYILQTHDTTFGGFGTGRKFPQGLTLDFSLDLYEDSNDLQWLNLVQTTLVNQYTNIDELETNYNLFDPIEGGFHRYGVDRDWTPPHYEKMLYDNARLLRAYSHLLLITPEDKIANEVVEKTLGYIKSEWYDDANGGFYANTDVNGEEHYYGENPRPEEKARVEQTKFTDWNSEAIITYLYLFDTSGNEEYKDMASKSLDFFQEEMLTENGAYHYQDSTGEKGVQGNLFDNAYLLLALVEGYEVLGDETFLVSAEDLADYSLENLYDWNSGGFFERNSPNLDLYPAGEEINLGKPIEENGIMAYALLKLYSHTKDPAYLNAGLKTIGQEISNVGGLDRGYYYSQASEYIIENNLIFDYNSLLSEIESLELENEEFWLDSLLEQPYVEFEIDNEGIEIFEGPLILLLIIAIFAGFISFASPCSLPIIPAYIAYTFKSSKKNVMGMTLAFFVGLSLIFVILGMSASLVGNILKSYTTLFSQIAGVAILVFGIYILLGNGFSGIKIKQKKPATYAGSFLFGAVMGISWTPCVGPILVGILLLASTTGSVFTGGLLLFGYALGLAIPLIILSFYLSRINKEGTLWKILQGKVIRFKIGKKEIITHTSSIVSGVIFIILGILIFSGTLFTLNQYLAATPFQALIFNIEEWLLGLIQ